VSYHDPYVPVIEDDGVRARLIAGSAFGATSGVRVHSPLFYAHLEMQAGTRAELSSTYPERAAYVVSGSVEVAGTTVGPKLMIVFVAGSTPVLNARERSTVMVLGGEPVGPRHVWWNFVSSSRERIEQAKLDWTAWLGTAPEQRFDPDRFVRWRHFKDFGGGVLTDLLTHWIDVVHWYLGVTTPQAAVVTSAKYRIKTMDWPDTVTATLEYPKDFMVTHTGTYASSIDDGGLEFRGDQATLKIDRDRLAVYSEASRDAARRGDQPYRPTPDPEILVRSQADGTIDLNPPALQASGIGISQVVQALQAQNVAAPVGRITGDLEERTIRLRGRLDTPEEFAQIVVAEQGGRVIRLGDVARVHAGTEEQRSAAMFSGEQAVGIDMDVI
jgi:hypothetical protein